jgi:hypothetical protein
MEYQELDLSDAVSLYLELAPSKEVDLEVAAAMAIDWSRAMKAASAAIEPEFDYRVSLIAAKPGSKHWLAKIERSKPNKFAKEVAKGWEEVPLILRWTIALAVVIPGTAIPTWEYWTGSQSFSETQIQQMDEAFARATQDEGFKGHKRKMYKDAQRDRSITGVGGGVPDGPTWKPIHTVPANQFPLADGLFELDSEPEKRVTPQELDVILVSPDLENAQRTWVFKQQGISGKIRAVMRDKRFLDALEKSEVRERFRSEIPMRIRLEIEERLIDGKWKVSRGGRSVVEVISPEIG